VPHPNDGIMLGYCGGHVADHCVVDFGGVDCAIEEASLNTVTRIFVVLQLVLALALSVLVVVFVSKQTNYRNMIVSTQRAAIAASAGLAREKLLNSNLSNELATAQESAASAQRHLNSEVVSLQGKLADAQTQIAELQASNSAKSTNVSLLTNTVHSLNTQVADETSQLNKLRPELLQLINQRAQLSRRVTELTNERNVARKTIQVLQESVAKLTHHLRVAMAEAKSPSSSSMANVAAVLQGVPTATMVNGSITKVARYNGKLYVSCNLGSKDGVNQGTRLTVYRGNKYVADILVQRSDATHSVGVVTLQAPNQMVAKADMVMSGPGM
jgi:chorismate mutase